MKFKKAQINDMIFCLVFLTSIGLTALFAAYIYYEIQPELNNSTLATNESRQAYNDFGVAFPMIDTSFMFIVLALIIGLVVSSLFIPSSPIFIVINIFGMLILILLGAVFANVYGNVLDVNGTYTNMSTLASTTYPAMSFIISNLPYIGVIIVLITSIVMYSKSNE